MNKSTVAISILSVCALMFQGNLVAQHKNDNVLENSQMASANNNNDSRYLAPPTTDLSEFQIDHEQILMDADDFRIDGVPGNQDKCSCSCTDSRPLNLSRHSAARCRCEHRHFLRVSRPQLPVEEVKHGLYAGLPNFGVVSHGPWYTGTTKELLGLKKHYSLTKKFFGKCFQSGFQCGPACADGVEGSTRKQSVGRFDEAINEVPASQLPTTGYPLDRE